MKPVKTDISFPTLEAEILDFWRAHKIMDAGLAANQGKEAFVFYDGPPFATGTPHYGHILAGTLKDIVPRFWAMKGKYVPRRWGWDCHGLPVEYEIERELGLQGLHDIQKMGVDKFNEACRSIVLRYTKEWQRIIERTGRWVDFKNAYRTMDPNYMETVWWVVKSLWDQGLIFEGHRVMPYSWRVSTPLSNFEAQLNYKQVQDPSITLRLKSKKSNRYFLVWTTTPWTLPSNLAIAANPQTTYCEIALKSGEHYVLAKERIASLYPDESEFQILNSFLGESLEGESYEPVFPYFAHKAQEGAFRVLLADYVDTHEGTGLVHQAPAFGEDDMATCQRYGITLVDPIDNEGRFTSEVPEYAGLHVKEADKSIIRDLKARGALIRQDTLEHNYPYCWRTDTPLIYKAISTWFVKIEPIKAQLLKSNAETHWVPEHLRLGRFGNWLENARDWNISRNRFWGTPLPIWRCECGEMECLGSREALKKRSGKTLTDLHKHFVDAIEFPCLKCKQPMKRIPEVLDCWFESGSMPYGQLHYPFENEIQFEKNFPADFIAEGLDQTRGWFYTLLVLGTALFKKSPFKNVIVNGLILTEEGKKMSKSLKNYPDPEKMLDLYGADAIRAYLMSSPASHAEEFRFAESGVKEVVRQVLLPYWNAYSFLVTYALADGWDPNSFDKGRLSQSTNLTDRWILSRLQTLIRDYESKMAAYHLYEVTPLLIEFIDNLTNWYIRLNRRRFWKEDKGEDKQAAYHTLFFVLSEFSKLLAPILPFVTESVYQNLLSHEGPASIHLCSFPVAREAWIDSSLEQQMALAQTLVSMGRNCRNNFKQKTRQPLRQMLIITKNPEDKKTIETFQDLLKSELNVKTVGFSSDETPWVTLTAKPNAKQLGPRLGQKMKLVSEKIRNLSPKELFTLEQSGKIVVEGETLTPSDVVIERIPKQAGAIQSEKGITLWLDTALDDDLIAEGLAREVVNRIQKLRKDTGLEVTDRIEVDYHGTDLLKKAIETHSSYVANEILAQNLRFSDKRKDWSEEQTIDDEVLKVSIQKV